MHVLVSVLGAVVVAVSVVVLDVLMLVAGVLVRVSDAVVFVFVGVRRFVWVGVVRHDPHLLCCAVALATTCSPASERWCGGTPGPACSALKTASVTNWQMCSFSML